MGLLSSFRKKQQESSAGNSDFYSRADEEIPAGRKRKNSKRDEPVDPVLPEKKRARRRLVGAIALVLAVVIGLPMILDPEPKPLSGDINIQIPSRDTPASAPAPAVADNPKKAAMPEAPAAEPVPQPEPAAKVPATPVTPEPKPTATKPAEHKPETPAHDKPHVTPPAVADKPAADKSADAARARAILEGKAVAQQPPKTAGKVAIQVAALASQDKVNELQKKLQAAGLKSYTQKVSTSAGSVIRVRVGPFANEAEAEKARAKLTKAGLSGKLVPA